MKKKVPQKLQIWIEARNKYYLSDAQIQMARELGMNPKKFGKISNHEQELWKIPLPKFIEECYYKRYNKTVPDKVLSIENRIKEINHKKELKHTAKLNTIKNGANTALHGTEP